MRDDDFSNFTHRCAACDKRFAANARVWGYWYGSAIVCSYSCMRAMERADRQRIEQEEKRRREAMETVEKQKKPAGRHRKATAEQIAEIIRLRETTNLSFSQIGKQVGVPTSSCSKIYANANGRTFTQSAPEREPEPVPEQPQPAPVPDLEGVLLTPDEAALALGYDPTDKRGKADFKNLVRSAKRVGFTRTGPGVNTSARYSLQDIAQLKAHDERRKNEQATSHTPRMDVVDAVRAWLTARTAG